MTSLFFLGATGYIGGALLPRVKEAFPDVTITAIIRSADKKAAIEKNGADRVIIGSYQDLKTIHKAAFESDIVLNAASADDMDLVRTLITALKERAKANKGTGRPKPILLHTSGTAIITVGSDGKFVKGAEKIWNDNDENDMRSIDVSQPHRPVDLEVINADEAGDISTYTVVPSTINGRGKGPGNKISIQIPYAVKVALRRRQVTQAGDGSNVWTNVHLDDLVELYIVVLKLAISGKDKNKTFGKVYFGSVGEYTWKKVYEALVPILFKRGLIDTESIKVVSPSEEPTLTASNSRSVSERGYSIGWKPTRPSIFDTLEEDVDAIIAAVSA